MNGASIAKGPRPLNPPFNPRLILAIEDALRAAWQDMMGEAAFVAGCKHLEEDDFTLKLEETLYELWTSKRVAKYHKAVFQRTTRGSHVRNYNGKKINKQPDLVFSLSNRRKQALDGFNDGHYVECKMIRQAGSNVGEYLSQGLIRFLRGDYAWAMPHGGMIAYVKTDQILPSALESHISRVLNRWKYNTDGAVTKSTAGATSSNPTYVTNHDRKFKYPKRRHTPGQIEIRHLWFVIPLNTDRQHR